MQRNQEKTSCALQRCSVAVRFRDILFSKTCLYLYIYIYKYKIFFEFVIMGFLTATLQRCNAV